ncbi:MAG: aldehyde dehydrogenase (NADP(+)) [Ferruginibacter sp.]
MITGKNLIGYTLSGKGNNTFSSSILQNDNPSVYSFHEASPEEIDTAAMLAHKAFSTYRFCTPDQKKSFLEKIAEAIANSKDELVKMAMHETHLPKPRLEGEVQRTINQAKLFASILEEGSWVKAIIDTAQPGRTPLPKPDIRQMQIPLGAVAVFGASNFPFAFSVAGGDTISALAAGCPVVYKAHPGHPATSELVGTIIIDIAKECGMPEGVFSLLQSKSNECSIQLVTHPLIKAVGFTGSFTGGEALFDAAAKRTEPIPVYAEMGSVNPVFILPEIMEQQATALAEKLAGSNLLSAGQFCTNPGVIISLRSPGTDNFLDHFSTCVKNAGADSMLNENICNNYNSGIKKLLNSGDITLQSSGKETSAMISAIPYMFQTSAKIFLSNKELAHEVFGPSSIHVVADNEEELYAVARQLTGQLTASIWGTDNDLSAFSALANELELKAGRIIFNNVPTGVEVTHAMVHGGPYPATSNSQTTSVGSNAIYRFTRAVSYQNSPQLLLPDALKNENPLHILRQVNGVFDNNAIV